MQGQRSAGESYPGTFEFDLGSTTNRSGMDRQNVWNNLLLDPDEDQDLPDYVYPPRATDMLCLNSTTPESVSLTFWNSDAPESSENLLNQGNLDETKMENGWAIPATVNGGSGPRTEDKPLEANSTFSSEDVNVNLNSNRMDIGHPFSQYSISAGSSQNFSQNLGHIGTSSQVVEAGFCTYPYTSGVSGSSHVSSSGTSNASESSSRRVGLFLEDKEDRPSGSDGQRLPCKRKHIEEAPEQHSANSILTHFPQSDNSSLDTNLNISGPSSFLSGVSPAQLNPRFGTVTRMMASDSHPFGSTTENAENYQRNFWMRTNHAPQHDTGALNLWPPTNTTSLANVWSTTQQSAPPLPFSQLTNQEPALPIPSSETLEPRPVSFGTSPHAQLQIPAISGLPCNLQPRTRASSSRIGASSSSSISVGERLPEETHSRRISWDNTSENLGLAPSNETGQPVQISPNWVLPSSSAAVSGNVAPASRAGSSSGVRSSPGPGWVAYQSPSAQRYRSLAEAVRTLRRSLSSTISTGQNVNVTPHPSLQTATSQDIGHQPGAGVRSNAEAYMRSAVLLERRRHGLSAVPVVRRVSAASRESRSRMMSERIRSVIDLIQRGENFQLQDLFMFDPSLYFDGDDLIDRHRDMRLDVDNMSYEELLALGERIGNVSTGLSEEKILKCLKQLKHSCVGTSAEVGPCCICQEEYIDNEDLGMLDCGHDFHTACIKKWLMDKNQCPICKTTALSEA